MIRCKKYILISFTCLLIINSSFSQTQLSDPGIGLLFFINPYSGIERCKTNGSERKLLLPWVDIKAQGLAIDPIKKHLYWTDWVNDKIQRSDFNGDNIETILDQNIMTPEGLDVDPYQEKIFWVDNGNYTINTVNFDGTDRKEIINYNHVNLDDIYIDTKNKKLYWTEFGDGAPYGKVSRANYDGSQRETLISIFNAIIKGLIVDIENNEMFWTDCGFNKIQKSDLNGNHIIDIIPNEVSSPNSMDIDRNTNEIIWSEIGGKKISKSYKDGSNIKPVINTDINSPQDLVIYNLDLVSTKDLLAITLHVYPNPASKEITIETDLPIDEIKIYNSLGLLLIINSKKTIDISQLPPGHYFGNVIFNSGHQYFKFQKI